MNMLGIETSTRFGSVALMDEMRLIAEYRVSLEMRHAERLLPLIDAMLKESRVPLSDLNAIAVSIGPGSFTGLRVGLATAKGLAMGSGLPLVPVPTLEAMARPFYHFNTAIVPLVIARKDEVYWSMFSPEGERLFADSVGSIDNVLEAVGQKESALFVGDGALLHQDKIGKHFKGRTLFPSIGLQLPMASAVAQMGLMRFKNGALCSAEEVTPIYLHELTPNTIPGKSL